MDRRKIKTKILIPIIFYELTNLFLKSKPNFLFTLVEDVDDVVDVVESLASNCCSWLGALLGVLVVELAGDDEAGYGGGWWAGGGAYCMQLDASGEVASRFPVVLLALLPVWWFSVCLLNDLASQYDFPQPSALHSYGFLFRCVNMCPFL